MVAERMAEIRDARCTVMGIGRAVRIEQIGRQCLLLCPARACRSAFCRQSLSMKRTFRAVGTPILCGCRIVARAGETATPHRHRCTGNAHAAPRPACCRRVLPDLSLQGRCHRRVTATFGRMKETTLKSRLASGSWRPQRDCSCRGRTRSIQFGRWLRSARRFSSATRAFCEADSGFCFGGGSENRFDPGAAGFTYSICPFGPMSNVPGGRDSRHVHQR